MASEGSTLLRVQHHETRLTELTPDTDAYLDGFQLRQADRMAESGKRKGRGLAVFVNDR